MLDKLKYEDVPEKFYDVVDVIGMESFKDLVKLVGGSSVYIPSERSLVKHVRDRCIRREFEGNYREFSRRYGISEMQVRNIVKGRES